MKAAICLLALCLAGYVSASHYAWQNGKQYTYSAQGRLFSGQEFATQYAGLQFRYEIVVTVTGPNNLHLNPRNFRAVEVNGNIEAGWRDGELKDESPVQIKKELLEYLESNIELEMQNGVVKSIKVRSDLPTWAVNIKKAQVSHLVLDTTGSNAVLSGNLNRQTNSVRPEEANQESGYFFETMEETVHGECETYYTISQNGPFDWPNQFQQQVQPGQQSQRQRQQRSQNGQDSQSDEDNQNDSQQQQDRQQQQSQEDDSNSNQQSSEESYRRAAKYNAYKRLAQRQDSQSAEDSRETFQGELPWPKAFDDFCNNQDQVYEIVKTVNFTACKNKQVLAYSTNAGLYGNGGDNAIGGALTRVLVSRYLACGKDRKQFTILKIEQEEQVNYGIRLDQNTFAGSIQNITLQSIANAQRVEPLQKTKTIDDLTYTFDPQEQEKQREGKLRSAYVDIMEENDDQDKSDSSSSEEYSTTTQGYSRRSSKSQRNQYRRQSQESQDQDQQSGEYQYQSRNQADKRRGGRKPRSVNSGENSDSQESQESQENGKPYKTNAEGIQTLKHPNNRRAPMNPLLVSPLTASGMQKRVETLMAEIVEDITTDKQPMAEAETLSKISTIAKILRYLDAEQILALYHKLAAKSQTEEDQTARSVFLDAMAIAGTSPNHVTLFELIKTGEISGEQANQLVMTLPMYARTPTKAYLREFYQLVESSVVEKSLQLKTTALLAFSNVLYQSFVNLRIKNSRYPVAQYGEFGNERDLQELYLPYFQKNLREYAQKEQSEGNNKHFTIVHLIALGNLGVKEIVQEVQQILDDSADPYIKTKAVLALHRVIVSRQTNNIPVHEIHGQDRQGQDQLTDEVVEKQVLPVLMSVAFDKGEHPEVRMAAISLLLFTTNADVATWQQLAYSTWFESSQEVHSFVYSSLKSLAKLDQNVPSIHYRMQQKARAVLAIAKPITPGYAKSRNSFSAGFAEHLQSNYIQQFSYFGSKDSNSPNYVFYRNFAQYGNKYVGDSAFQFNLHGHTIQKLASFVLAQYQKQDQNDKSSHRELDQIFQILNIERREQNEDIEGSLQIKFHEEMERVWSINEDIIEELTKRGLERGLPKLLAGIPFNYQKTVHAAESVFEMPSIFGVPITFNYRMPIHISARGNARLVSEGKDYQIQAEIHPVYAIKTHARLSFKVPFTGKKYQSGLQRHFVVEAPFRALARRAPSGQYVVAFTPSQLNKGAPSGPIPLFTFHQKPYTAIITDSLWPTTHKEGGQMNIVHVTDQPFKRQAAFGQRVAGLAFKTEEISEYRSQNERNSGWVRFWQRFHSAGCAFQLSWLGGEKIRYVERKLILDIANSETKTIVFAAAGKREQSASAKDLWQDSSSQSSQSTEESASSESQQNSSSQQQDSNEPEDQSSSRQYQGQQSRRHGSASDSGASQSAEDYSQKGFVYAFAILGKQTPIRPVQDGQSSIQKILKKGSPSTVQYLLQVSKSSGRVYIRAATGDAANEAAKALPQTSNSLQALRQAIVESPNTKAQQDGCAEFEGEYDAPKYANRGQLLVLRKQLLAQELAVKVKAELQFGETCKKMPYEIKVQGQLKRGQKQTEYAQSKSRQAQKCAQDEEKGFFTSPVCMYVAEQQAAALNNGDFKVQFTQMPKQFINRTDDVEDFAKALLYPYVSTDRFHDGAGKGQLRVEFHITPNKEFLDVHITKPNSKLSFQSIRTNRAIRAALPFTATQSLVHNMKDRALRSESDPSCSIQGNFVNTFDNVTYRFSDKAGTNCYHVLAQDCSGRSPASVLVRDIATNQKKVVIYLSAKTKIELSPYENQQQQQRGNPLSQNSNMRVHINDQHVESLPRIIRSKSSGRVIASIQQTQDQGVQVFSQYFDVATNAEYVVVFGSNQFRNRTCGVCGDFNGEKTADMKSPQNCPLSSGSALVASYAMKPQAFGSQEKGVCQVDAQLKKQVQRENSQCLQDQAYLPNNPARFPNSQRPYNQVGQSQDCINKLVSAIRTTVYNIANTVMKPIVWWPATRHKYANKAADYVASKVADYLKDGSAQKISEAMASGLCEALGFLPVVGSAAKAACKLGKSWIVKGLLIVVNKICRSTGCCTPSLSMPDEAEWEQTLNFAFPEEAAIREDADNSYLTDAEASLDCHKKTPLMMGRSIGHLVHLNLFGQEHLSQSQRNHLADKVKDEIYKVAAKAIKDGKHIAAAVGEAVERVMPSNVHLDIQAIEQAARHVLQNICQKQKCCYPGQA